MKRKNNNKAYMTPNEVADLLMVSPATVRQWTVKGDLKSLTTPGGHRRFLYKDIAEFAKQRQMKLPPYAESAQEMRVLIVDNDEQLVRYLVSLLTSYDEKISIESAKDGFDAGQKVIQFKPTTILLDLMMPGLSGFEVCKHLRSNPRTKHSKIIAMTGYYTKDNIDSILQAGADACLPKPIDSKLLLATMGLEISAQSQVGA